jgi:hypothetical protein
MFRILSIALVAATAMPASAAIVWTDWTSVAGNLATGTLGTATVTLNGPFDTTQVAGGTDYWRIGGVNPWPAYDGVSNLPTNNDFISPAGSQTTHVINFSTPVTDPYLAIISLGQGGIQTNWDFVTSPFTLIDQGQGFWGNGVFTIAGNTIAAGEAHGIIRFQGSYSSITLITNNTENWSGLTIGTAGGVVPEPATWAMLIAGFGLVGATLRRRRPAFGAVSN